MSQIFLPVYICSQGVGVISGGVLTGTGCDASNGTLNPNNPFAAQGIQARLLARPIYGRETATDAATTRFSGGIDGTYHDTWNYHVAVTSSQVVLQTVNKGYIWLPGLENAVAQGTYNFVDPYSNDATANQALFPDNHNTSRSQETEALVSLDHDFFMLPGGALNVAVSGQYRYEAIHNPSANPPNNLNPEQRYYGINAVGVDGSRQVWSGAFQISAPITDSLRLKAEGSYDHYSTGQGQFSPKVEAEFRPIDAIKLRGTYSQGLPYPELQRGLRSADDRLRHRLHALRSGDVRSVLRRARQQPGLYGRLHVRPDLGRQSQSVAGEVAVVHGGRGVAADPQLHADGRLLADEDQERDRAGFGLVRCLRPVLWQ